MFKVGERNAPGVYNEGAFRKYGGVIKFAEKSSGNDRSIKSNQTRLIAIRNEEIDLLFD